jgi:hypothetical protein
MADKMIQVSNKTLFTSLITGVFLSLIHSISDISTAESRLNWRGPRKDGILTERCDFVSLLHTHPIESGDVIPVTITYNPGLLLVWRCISRAHY